MKIKLLVLLLVAGVMIGPVAGVVNPDQVFGSALFPIVSLGVSIILFEGGMRLQFSGLRAVRLPVLSLTTVGAVVSWAGGAVLAWWLLGFQPDVALLLGAILPLAFAPFDLWPLAMLSPAGLFLLWRDCDARGGFRRGWLFGFGMWGAGVYWIYFSLHHFGAAIAPLAALFTVLFALGLALTLAVLGALVTCLPPARRGAA